MLRDYPHTAILADGVQITLRPMQREDGPALIRFFQSLPGRTGFIFGITLPMKP